MKVRLTAEERAGIIEGLSEKIGDIKAELLLYGSRADPALQGGDIDLLLKVEEPDTAKALNAQAHVLLNSIKKRIGDRKIDLSVKDSGALREDPFWAMALQKSVLLKRWAPGR
ncbi:MAG: nucleotidyltransferase domain-containing protein [Deltaproteobacteria bacterium]|nr:nucleotidyltransferase domain-containing protein [Deltaproteobacteria bacterium]